MANPVRRHSTTVQARIGEIEKLSHYFVDLVRPLPTVQQVLLDHIDEVPRVWTVVIADTFDWSLLDRIFDAELQTMLAYPDVKIDFRVAHPDEPNVLASGSSGPEFFTVLWDRRVTT